MNSTLGLIVAGDYALATGADLHVAFAASVLSRHDQTLAWAWLVPADRTQLAAALHEAWQRPHAVVCFGGLGSGADDHVRLAVRALQAGREQVGLMARPERIEPGHFSCGNITFFPGAPEAAHALFEQWWTRQVAANASATNATAVERVRWTLPESASAANARRQLKVSFPAISQRVVAGTSGSLSLLLSGPSKGKVQQARKSLQQALSSEE